VKYNDELAIGLEVKIIAVMQYDHIVCPDILVIKLQTAEEKNTHACKPAFLYLHVTSQ